LGRVIGEDILAPRPIPPKNNSAMDGYAIRWEDTRDTSQERPVILEVIEDIPAGSIPRKVVGSGQATRIMTGARSRKAPMPSCGWKIPRKMVGWLKSLWKRRKGRIFGSRGRCPAGRGGHLRGCMIRPAEIGMMAALGRSFISVYQKPLVAVLATGDELVDVDENPSPWQIISSTVTPLPHRFWTAGRFPCRSELPKIRGKILRQN